MPASTLSLYNAANMPPSHQNLISNKNFGLYLSIDTKNSPLNSVLLPKSGAESQTLPLKNFKPKKVEISNFDLQKHYISQKKAENKYNLDSARKSTILYKKIFFFSFF